MNTNPLRVLFLAVSLLLLITGGWYLYSRPIPPELVVLASQGTSAVDGGSVLLPGDVLEAGKRVRVGSSPLYAQFGDETMARLEFDAGTVFRHRGRPLGPKSAELEVESGRGVLQVETGSFILDFPAITLLVEKGTLRWRLRSTHRELTVDPSVQLFLVSDGGTVPVEQTDVAVSETSLKPDWPVNSHPLEEYEQYSTLRPGKDVLRSLAGHSEPDEPAESLLEVFGHWVRDQWGNVYLYNSEGNQLNLRSAGPDERMFTVDDRRWSARVSR